MVPTATVTAERASLTLARFREVDPRETVLMKLDPLRSIPDDPRQPFTAAEWSAVDPDHPVLNVTTDAPGLLVDRGYMDARLDSSGRRRAHPDL